MKLWHYRCLGGMAGIVVGGALVLALTSCDSQAELAGTEAETYARADQLSVTHDATRGVTCWSRYGYPDTLSCLPDWMLDAPARKPVTDHCLVKDVGKSDACRRLFAQ
jgi:hypothetical protein